MKKTQRVFIFLFLSLFLLGCQNIFPDKQVMDILVDSESLKTSYDIETFDISLIKLVINYNDETYEVINLSTSLISSEDLLLLSEPGTHNIVINYEGMSTTLTLTLINEESILLHIYSIGVESGIIDGLTYEGWIESIRGEQGLSGREVTFTISSDYIQWKYVDETEWKNLIPIASLTGPQGADGSEIEIRVENLTLQWKYVDESVWEDIFDLSSLQGIQGLPGTDGREVTFTISSDYIQWKYVDEIEWKNLIPIESLTGPQGADASEVEIRVENLTLQWKYVDSLEWTEIFDLNLLQGPQGEDGLTPYIGGNGNWFIGEVDTLIPAIAVVANMDRIGTDGLYFDLTIRNGIAGYEVVSYSGTETDIVVPNEIFGQKVISIKQGALPTTITSLSLSKYTEVLPSFQSYLNLETIDLNNAPVVNLPNNAFRDAKKLKTILNYSNIENIGDYAFYNTMILFNEFDFMNVVNIGQYAFYVSSATNLSIEGVIIITDGTAYTISNQTFIYLPETVLTIGTNAFPSQFSIYYAGNSIVNFASEFFFQNVKKTDDGYWYVDRNTYVGLLNYTGDLSELNVPNQLDGKSVNAVENYAFLGNNQVSRINLPTTITSIGDFAFVLTRQLYILYIPSSIVNISNSYFGQWLGVMDEIYAAFDFPSPVIVFENNQVDMNFGTNTIADYEWGRYAFGYSSSEIKQDENFVYLEKTLTAEILAIKNTNGKVIVPALYNFKPVSRINQYALIGPNGGTSIIDISNGVEYISTSAFYKSSYLRYVNIPSSVSAVNYLGFNQLSNLEIHVQATEKPINWDSTWYSGIKTIIWNSYFEGEVSSDGKYLYSLLGDDASIIKYFGLWDLNNPLIIPETIDSHTVTTIESNAFRYTTSTTTLEVVIPNTVTLVKQTAFTYYRNLIVYSSFNERPIDWHAQFGYSYYWGSSTDSYRTYYWLGTWSLINENPTPN